MFQDSVPVGSYNDPFLSSVIPMVAPTWCHRALWGNLLCGVNVDWLEFWIDTFELVIHLNKVQQSALRLFSLWESPAIPAVPEIPVTCSFMWCCAKLLKPPFLLQPQLLKVQHDMCESRQQACPFPAGVVSLVSGEVIHFVHLIRWNLKAVLCLGGWLEHGPVVAQLREP